MLSILTCDTRRHFFAIGRCLASQTFAPAYGDHSHAYQAPTLPSTIILSYTRPRAMPQIEELQTSAKPAAPGWSYVVDTGFDPSKVAINPTSRKRQRNAAIDAAGTSRSDLSLRQQAAIQRHLADLDRDNNKDQHIPIPRSKHERKQTTNVQRVLKSGKDFAYYVHEEEALLAAKGGVISVPTETSTDKTAQRASKTPIARRKSALLINASSNESSPAPLSTPTTATAVPISSGVQPSRLPIPTAPGAVSPDQLLLNPAPRLSISEAEIETLLSAPPLTYNAAKSAPPPANAPPRRVFCEICGYWGRAKCMKCGARVCGIECRNVHDESRCIKFYA